MLNVMRSRVPVAVLFSFLLTACGGGGGGAAPAPVPTPGPAPGPGPGPGPGPQPQAGVIALPKTGQVTCFSTFGSPIACAGTGQDGDLQTGVVEPSPRFTVGSAATVDCVTDNLTGLMWVRSPSTVNDTWTNALTSANDLVLCGFSDWRLPNRDELRSLINYNVARNFITLNTLGFSNVTSGRYWSSTSYASSSRIDSSMAWYVSMTDGHMRVDSKGIATRNYIWPVRSVQ
jgi:hypothetical protein